MITKAIVDSIVDRYSIRVRIPILDKIEAVPTSTDKNDLSVASVCVLPRCDVNLRPGDIVFVGFEDDDYTDVVILGCLYREAASETTPDQVLSRLIVESEVTLPPRTTIGNVSAESLSRLVGLKDSVQGQLDTLKSRIDNLSDTVSTIKSSYATKEDISTAIQDASMNYYTKEEIDAIILELKNQT